MGTNLLKTLISARSLQPAQEVDLWYSLHKSLDVLCDQLDADGTVNDTNYAALCFDAIVNCVIVNSQGDSIGQHVDDRGFCRISPTGFTNDNRHWVMYNYMNAWETLCEKLDDDSGVTDADYEALCFPAALLSTVKDPKGVTDMGSGANYYFDPSGKNRKWLVQFYFDMLTLLETLTEKLDADGGVTDTDYEANTYTAYCLIQVENSAGTVVGN